MPSAYENIITALESHGSKRHGRNMYNCPGPSHATGDRNPSLSVGMKSKGNAGAVLRCFAGCATADVTAALGLTLADLFDEPRVHSDPVRAQLRALRERAAAYPWQGRTARRDRKVMLALTDRAVLIGQATVSMSLRELGTLCVCGEMTASRALHELHRMRAVRLGRYLLDGKARASTLNLSWGMQRVQNGAVIYTEMEVLAPLPTTYLTAPNCTLPDELRNLLRDTGVAVYLALTPEPQAVKAIADVAGVHPSTASRKLRGVLVNLGLAQPAGNGWVIGPRPRPLDEGSLPSGNSGHYWHVQAHCHAVIPGPAESRSPESIITNVEVKAPSAAFVACGYGFPARRYAAPGNDSRASRRPGMTSVSAPSRIAAGRSAAAS